MKQVTKFVVSFRIRISIFEIRTSNYYRNV